MSAAREQLAALLWEELDGTMERSDSDAIADWLIARGVTIGVSSLRAPQSGPWKYVPIQVPHSGVIHGIEHHYSASPRAHGGMQRYNFDTEAEAIAVRDTLNRVAGSGAETPPQPEIP